MLGERAGGQIDHVRQFGHDVSESRWDPAAAGERAAAIGALGTHGQ
jgi:hypothetical protein